MAGMGGLGGGMGGGGMGGMGGIGGMGSMASSMEQQRMMAVMQEMQVADSLRLFNDLVGRCFGECVDGFRTKKLDGKEEACIRTCATKFVRFSTRAGLRFAEHQQESYNEAMAKEGGGASR